MNLLQVITPINLKEEKDKYFNSQSYTPIFRYNWENDVNIKEKNKEKEQLIQAIIRQDTQAISSLASEYFEVVIEESTLSVAKGIIESHDGSVLDSPDIETVKNEFEKAFNFFLLPYKAVIVDQPGFNFRPNNKEKELLISKYANFENFSLDGEILHEMTHIIRYENGKNNQLKKDNNYLPTEEGLAAYLQDYKGYNGSKSLFQHAAEYAGTEVSLKGSLNDVVKYFQTIGCSNELAWQRAIRHKFGFKDTSKAGDIMKPAMYFFYEQKIKNITNDDLLSLFSGKVTLDYKEEYKGKVPKEKIVEFFKL